METSLYIEYVKKWFKGILLAVVETLNGTKNPATYRHRSMLRRQYSVDGKWETMTVSNSTVAADIVAMDSPLPLKKRESYGKAGGEIPKMGLKFRLNERQMKDLDILRTRPNMEEQFISRLFNDAPKTVIGFAERNEALFLEALSSGVILVEDDTDASIGIRLNFGYPEANQFGADSFVWSNASSLPWNDIRRVIKKASDDGNQITRIMLDVTAQDYLLSHSQTKELYAFQIGFIGGSTPVPALDQEKLNSLLRSRENGVVFELVDRVVKIEKNGTRTVIRPWVDGRLVFIGSETVGTLAWTDVAEMNHRKEGVTYEVVDDFILVSQYRNNEPSLSEWTAAQGMVLPVIDGVDSIYTLDSKTVEA